MPVKRGVIWGIQPKRGAFSASSLMGLEMLPLGRRLILELLLEELTAAGVVEGYLLSNATIPAALQDHTRPDEDLLDWCLHARSIEGAARIRLHRVPLPEGTSLGEGLLEIESCLQGEPFLIVEADRVWTGLPGQPTMTARMVDVLRDAGADVVSAATEVTPSEVPLHTVLRSIGDIERKHSFFVRDFIEHPAPGEESSRFAIAGRYACRPIILDYLREARGHYRVDLVGAMRRLAHDRDAVWATRPLHGEHCFSLNNLLQYARAFLNYALDDAEIGLAVRDYMEDLIGVRWT